MSTQAQIEANRANAQKSTGPKTEGGKSATAKNALKHGLLADRFAIAEQDRVTFDRFPVQLVAELVPVGQMETLLANRIATLSWRLTLAERAQTSVLYVLTCKTTRSISYESSLPPFSSPQAVEDYILGRTILHDFSNEKVLDRLAAYERRIERSLAATRKEFYQLQSLHEKTDADGNASVSPANRKMETSVSENLQTNPIPVTPNATAPIIPNECEGPIETAKFDLPTSDSCLLTPDSKFRQTNPIYSNQKPLNPYQIITKD